VLRTNTQQTQTGARDKGYSISTTSCPFDFEREPESNPVIMPLFFALSEDSTAFLQYVDMLTAVVDSDAGTG
jgi:hypothetical protein